MKKMKKIISRILVLVLACLSICSVANAAGNTSAEVQITIEGKQETATSDKEDEDGKPDSRDEEQGTDTKEDDKDTDHGKEEANSENGTQGVQTGDKSAILTYGLGIVATLAVVVACIWKMKKKNKAFLMAFAILFSAMFFNHNALPVDAADSATNVDVTVPTAISVLFNEEGTNSVSEFGVENHMYAPITIDKVQVTECNDWKLVSKGKSIPANTKQLAFALEGQCLEAGENPIHIKVSANTDRQLNIGVARGAWSVDGATETALRLEFNYVVNWEETKAYATYCADDSSLNFYRSVEPIQKGTTHRGKVVSEVYSGFEEATYDWGQAPWYGTRSKIQKIEFHDPIQPISLSYWFLEFYHVTYADMTKLDTSRVTTMDYMCKSLGNAADQLEMKGLEGWDVSNVTSMSMTFGYMAYNAEGPVTIGDLSAWDVSNVTNMSRAFSDVGYYTTDFKLCGFENWNTANVTNMSSMFQRTGKYDPDWYLDLTCWNVNNVTLHNEFNLGVEFKITPPNWVK